MTKLVYKNKLFIENKDPDVNEMYISFDESNKKIILNVPPNVSLIDKLTAERQANGMARTGFALSNGFSIGIGFSVQVEGNGGQIPNKLRESPRVVY
ncbi:MAG: hypothetical protein ACTSUV_02975 [Candidatus Ranarchaeia archaeon]